MAEGNTLLQLVIQTWARDTRLASYQAARAKDQEQQRAARVQQKGERVHVVLGRLAVEAQGVQMITLKSWIGLVRDLRGHRAKRHARANVVSSKVIADVYMLL